SRISQFPMPFINTLIIVAVMYLLMGISRQGANFLLCALQDLVTATCTCMLDALGCAAVTSRHARDLMDPDKWPKDIRGVMSELDLDPQVLHFACCPKCCCCYAPTVLSEDRDSVYPDTCTDRETLGSQPCGSALTQFKRSHGKGVKPFRRFTYQPMKSWLGRLLSRPDLEKHLTSLLPTTPPPKMNDIWDAEVFRSFKGPDGQPFFAGPDNELRLAFSLFIDWFNPHGRKRNAKTISNVYLVGIIPGPSEPSTSQMNHFLRPLVDELLEFWDPGCYFSRTVTYPAGRLVRCALIPLICDVPALRKVAGFMGHSGHSFCSFCRLQDYDIANFDIESWPRYSWEEHVRLATMWRDAPTVKERERLFKENPVRWSELLRLPYWDITKYAILDAMHNLFLGDLKCHLVDIWKMTSTVGKTSKGMQPHSTEVQTRELQNIATAVKLKSASRLHRIRLGYLRAVAHENEIEVAGDPAKKDLICALIEWQKENPLSSIKLPKPSPNPVYDLTNPDPATTPILHKGILEEIWADMNQTMLPSWMARAPRNLGSPNQGYIKADQWRTACDVNLVITLIRLWGRPDSEQKHKDYLENFLALVTAVRWATKRSTSELHMKVVQDNFQLYLRSLVKLFPLSVLKPNHHLSLHLVECMRLFGPAHGWWAFPFERYNGVLGSVNTNGKEGEMELSFFTSFCRGGNLRALVQQRDLLGRVSVLCGKYISSVSTLQGSILSNIPLLQPTITAGAGRAEQLNDISYQGLLRCFRLDSVPVHYGTDHDDTASTVVLSRDAQFVDKITVKGTTYTTKRKVHRDSLIQFYRIPGEDSKFGQVEDIFLHTRAGPDGDPLTEYFLIFPLLDVRLCHEELLPGLVIRATNLIGHVVCCPYKGNLPEGNIQVVLSLCRVHSFRSQRRRNEYRIVNTVPYNLCRCGRTSMLFCFLAYVSHFLPPIFAPMPSFDVHCQV
ncbi:hypothetical protein BKA83DRAFT_118693, partial [Pisolithus microcarpus]